MLVPLALLLFVGGASGAPTGKPPDCAIPGWPQFRHDPCNTGSIEGGAAPSRRAVPGLRLAWSYRTGAAPTGSPVISRGVIYVAAGRTLHAVELATGSRRWIARLAGTNGAALAVSRDRIVTWETAGLRILDLQNGRLRRRVAAPNTTGGAPVVAGGLLVVTGSGGAAAFDLATGEERWRRAIDCFGCTAAAAGARVYLVGQEPPTEGGVLPPGGVHALDLRSGEDIWFARQGTNFASSSPSLRGGTVFVRIVSGTERRPQHAIVALDAATGQIGWRRPIGARGYLFAAMAASANLVFYPSTDGQLYAIDVRTGSVRWRALLGETGSSPAVANGVVYIVDSTPRLVALDARNGHTLWVSSRYDASSVGEHMAWWSSPAVAGGAIVVGTPDGRLLAYRATRG
jgi:outer membrane protein assembly factor BamB